jgi:hypothetical protein
MRLAQAAIRRCIPLAVLLGLLATSSGCVTQDPSKAWLGALLAPPSVDGRIILEDREPIPGLVFSDCDERLHEADTQTHHRMGACRSRPMGDSHAVLIERVRDELRRHPDLLVRAIRMARSWAPAFDDHRQDTLPPYIVTSDMVTSLVSFFEELESVTDNPEVAELSPRMRIAAQSREMIGLPVDRAVGRLILAFKAGEPADDASLRLGRPERGLAREGETVLIPAAAHVDGALGTQWRTDLVLTAVGQVNAQVAVALLPKNQENLDPEVLEIGIEGGQSEMLVDVLHTLFELEGAAALRLTCQTGAVIVTSRTYNLEGELGSPDARTFGQFVPALSADDAIAFGDQGRLLLLAHDPSLEQAQRTNLILVNGGDEEIEVEVELLTSNGDLLGVVSRTLRGWEYRHIDRAFEEVTSEVVDDGYAVVRVTTPGGRVYALASVVDNLTGDPVAVQAVLRSPSEEKSIPDTQIIQAAARVSGIADTDWRTDLVLHGMGGFSTTAVVELMPRGQENTEPVREMVQILNGQSVRYNDVLQTLFGTDGAASIRVSPYGGAGSVSSRTYNVLGEDNSLGYPAGATFGQYMGPVAYTSSIRFGEEAWIQHLSHDPSLSQGSRANLGLVNSSVHEIDVEVDLYQGDGTRLGGFTQTLRQWENVQISRVFERVTTEPVVGGYAVLRTTHPSGAFVAHGSVVDNRTGDPITVDAAAIRRPAPAGLAASGNMLMQLFESGFAPGMVFKMLRAGELASYLDDLAADQPDRTTRTAAGIEFDLGSGTALGGAMFASGRVGLEDASVTDGTTVTGTVRIAFDQTAVDGRTPLVDDLELGLDLTQVGGDQVAGTVSLGSTKLGKSVTQLSGSLAFDTRICELYPIGGSITVTIGGEQRTLTFSDRCDGGFDVTVPSAAHYHLTLFMNDCRGNPPADPQEIHLIDEDGELCVDPSSPPSLYGRRLFAATGRVLPSEASVRFVQKAGSVADGERRVGSFQGLYQSYQGGDGYYTGTYGYSVSEGECQSSYYHGRDDPDFAAGYLQERAGPKLGG